VGGGHPRRVPPDIDLDPDALGAAAVRAAALEADLRDLLRRLRAAELPPTAADRLAEVLHAVERVAAEIGAAAEGCHRTVAAVRAVDGDTSRTAARIVR